MPPLDPFDQVTLARFDAPDTTTPADSTPDEGTDPFSAAMPKPRMAPRPKRESAVDRLEAAGVGGKADPFSPAASRALMQDAARRDRQSAQASYDANAQIRAAAETQAAQQKQAKADAEAARKQANANREAYFKTNGIKHYTDAFGDIVPETHDDGAFRYQTSENGKTVIHRGTDAIGGDYRIERDDRGRTTTHDENQYRTFADDPGVVYRGGRDAKAKSTGAGAFDKTGWQKIASVDEALASDHEPLRAAGEAAAKERNQRLTNIGLEALKTREMAADVKLDAWKQKFGAERTEAESLDTEIARLSSHQGEKAGGFLGIGGDLTPAAVEAQKKLGQLQARRDQIGERPKDLGQAMDADPEAMAAREEGNVARREAADFARLVELHNGDVTAATRQWRAVLGDRAKDHPALVAMDQARQAWGMPSDQQFDEAKRAKQIEFLKQHTDPAVQALGGKLEALDARQKQGPGEKADFETRKAWADNLQKEYAAVEDQRAALQKREEEAAAAMMKEQMAQRMSDARNTAIAQQSLRAAEGGAASSRPRTLGGALKEMPFRWDSLTSYILAKADDPNSLMSKALGTQGADKGLISVQARSLVRGINALLPDLVSVVGKGDEKAGADIDRRIGAAMANGTSEQEARRQAVEGYLKDNFASQFPGGESDLQKWQDHARLIQGDTGGYGISPATGKFLVSDKVWKSPAWTQRMVKEADEGLIPGVQTDEQKKAFRDLVAAKQAADQQQLIDTAKKFPDWATAQAEAGDGATDQEVYDRWKAKGSAAKTAAAFFRNTAAGAVGLIESGINGAELWVRDKADAVGQWMGADFLKSSPDDFAKVLADFASPEGSMSAAIRNKDPRAEGFWSGTGDVIGSQLPGWLAAFALSRVPGLKNAATKATAINSTLTTLTYGLSEFASNYEQVYNSLLPKTPDGAVDQAAVTPEIQKAAHEAAMKTFSASMLGGASELLPLEKVFKAIPVGKMPRLVKMLKETASETAQEAFQNELDALVQGDASGGAASPEHLTDPGKWKEYAQMAGGMAMPIAAGILLKARQAHRWLAKNGKEADQMVQSIGSLDTAWEDYQGTASPDVVALGGIDPRGQTGRQMERAAALVKQYQTGTKPGEGTTVENKVEALQELQDLHKEIDGGFTGLARKLETAQKLAPVAQQIADFGPEQLATMLEAKGIAPEIAAQYVQNPDYVERQRTILSATVKAAMGNRDLMTQAEEQALGEMISPTGEASASPVERVYDFEGQPIVEERTRRTLLKFLPATAALFPDTEEQRKIAIRQAKEKAEADKIEAEKAKAAGKEPAKPAKGGASAGAEIPANATPEAPQSTVTGSTANTANATPSPLQSPASGTMLSENESAAVRDLSQHLTSLGLPEDEARTVATGHVVAAPEGTYAQYETVGGKGAMTFLRARGKLHDDLHSQGWRFENDQAIRPAAGVTSAKQGMPGTPESEVRQHVDAAVAKMDPVFQARIKFVGPKEGGIDQTGGMHATSGGDIMVSTEVLGQDLARMPADKRAARVEALLDEEVRHQVQFAQARRAFAQHKKKGETFDDFLNRYYGDIWREEFATKPKLVEALRQLRTAATFDTQPDWAKLFEAVRLLWQMKARGEASESFVALVQGIGAKTARYIKQTLDFLRDLATGKKAGKWVQAEIAALESLLKQNAAAIKARREIESLNNENHVLDPTHDQLPGLAPQGDSAGDRQPRPQGSVPTQGASPQGGATHAPKAPGKVGGRGQNGTNPGGTGATRGGDGAGAAPVGNRGSAQSGQGVQGNGVGGRTESVQGAGRRGAAVLSQLEDQRDALALEIRAMWATQPNAKAEPEAWKKWERIKSGMEAELRDLDDRIEGLAAAAESEIRDQLAPETSDQRPIDEAAHDAATSPKNDLPQPTDAQKEAGNYPMGHVTVGGLQVSIENPIGSTRNGTDSDGEKWSIQMKAHYGYIRGTEGKDGDHVDVFLNKGIPDGFAGPAFIVDQVNPKTGKFDEHKVVLGVKTLNDAKRLYLSHYTQGWKGLGAITEMPWDEFKVWALAGERTKPVGKLTTTVSDLAHSTAKAPVNVDPEAFKKRVAEESAEPAPAPSPEPAKKPGRKQKLREELEAAIRENERKGAKGKPKAQQTAAAPRTPEEQAVEDAIAEAIRAGGQTLASAPLAGAVEAPNAALLAALTKVGQAVHAAGHTTPAAFAERIIRGAWGQGATVGVRTVATAWTWTPSADFAKVPNWSKIVPAIEDRLRKQGLEPATPKASPQSSGNGLEMKSPADVRQMGQLRDIEDARARYKTAKAANNQHDASMALTALAVAEQGVGEGARKMQQQQMDAVSEAVREGRPINAEALDRWAAQPASYAPDASGNIPRMGIPEGYRKTGNTYVKNSEGEPMPEPAPASDPTAPQTGSSAESAIAESLPAEKPTVKPEDSSVPPHEMSPIQFQEATRLVRPKDGSTLHWQIGNAVYPIQYQKKGKLTAQHEVLKRYLHQQLIEQQVKLPSSQKSDSESPWLGKTLRERYAQNLPDGYKVNAEAVDALRITLPEGYVRDGDFYVYKDPSFENPSDPIADSVAPRAGDSPLTEPANTDTLSQDGTESRVPKEPAGGARGAGSGGDAVESSGAAANLGTVAEPVSADGGGTGSRTGSDAGQRDGRPGVAGGDEGAGRKGGKGKAAKGADSVESRDGAGVAERPQSPARSNYHLTDPAAIVGGGPKTRFARNRKALEVLETLQFEQREPTTEELDALAAYTGWGSFGQELFQGAWDRPAPKEGWQQEDQWLRDQLGEAAWKSAQASIINAHYTDPPTVSAMWEMVRKMGFTGGRVLEPSEGIGNFWSLMPRDLMAKSRMTGIELDSTTGKIAQLLHPQVNTSIMGYQQSQTADNFYDLVIGNWPFAKDGPADRRYNAITPSLHDYFFLKAIDQVRPGGLVVGITSSGTMDKKSAAARRWMASKAELVASYRLPTGAFEGYAGTKVVTDIIILRKREKPVANPTDTWIDVAADPKGQDFSYNRYYHEHPENILGKIGFGHGTTWSRPGMIVDRAPNFAEQLAALADRVPANVMTPWTAPQSKVRTVANTSSVRRQNAIVEMDGDLYQVAGEQLNAVQDLKSWRLKSEKQTQARLTEARGLMGLRDAYDTLMAAYHRGEEPEPLRQALRKSYDAFVKKHGPLRESAMLKIFDRLNEPSAMTLANFEDEHGKPRAILERDIMRKKAPTGAGSVEDAYAIQRNNSTTFDLAEVARVAGVTEQVAQDRLIALDQIFRTPTGQWEARDQYLAGNVRQKLREARDAEQQGVPDMARSIAALEAIQPPPTPYFDIEVRMGAAWIAKSDYLDFFAYLMNAKPESFDLVKGATGWNVKVPDDAVKRSAEATTQWGTQATTPAQILTAAMNGTSITIRYTDDDGVQHVDTDATDQANAKVEAVREELTSWIWQNPLRTARLSEAYNDAMNATVTPKRDGSHLRLEGLALTLGQDEFDFRKHQRDAVWRGVQDGRGMFAHEVGTGKTFTMAGLVMEGRRLGTMRKPIIFAHNANHQSVAADFRMAYPAGKFLHIDDLSPAKRQAMMRQIALDDWDAIIIPHSLIDRFTLKEETMMAMAQKEIKALEDEFYAELEELGVSDIDINDMEQVGQRLARQAGAATAKELAKARTRIIERIREKAQKNTAEDALFFEDLGVDAVLVDEAHIFKKIALATRKKIKGLNKTESGMGFSLSLLTDYLKGQNNGKGVYLFTGTPVTNTLNEVYNMMRYVMDDAMADAGIDTFDDWFNSFADGVTEIERTSGGTYEPVERLLGFINIPELARLAGQYFDVVQAKDMPEFKPRKSDEGITDNPKGRPSKKVIPMISEMSELQRDHNDIIGYRYNSWKAMSGKDKMLAMRHGGDSPIRMESEGAKSALDYRLMDHNADDFAGSKVNKAIGAIMEHHREHPMATQMVFMEQGYNDYTTVDVTQRDPDGNPLRTAEGKKITRKEKRRQFNLLRDMVQKLVDQGVDPQEIAIFASMTLDPSSERPNDVLRKVRKITAAVTKEDLAQLMREGKVRIAFGGTESMGTGVNAQTWLRAMHHIDAPWTPGALEQRNGRGWRQGNKWNTVLEYRYFTEGGHDAKRWQTLLNKVRFITRFTQALLTGGEGSRVLYGEGADTSESGAVSDFESSFSSAAGDPRLLKRAAIEKDIRKLERRRDNHVRAIADAQREIGFTTNEIAHSTRFVEQARGDLAEYNDFRQGDFAVTVMGKTYDDRTAANEAWLKAPLPGKSAVMRVQMGPFQVWQEEEKYGSQPFKTWIEAPSGAHYSVRTPSIAGVEATLRGIAAAQTLHAAEIERKRTSIASLQEMISKPFGREAELVAKQQQLAILNRELALSPIPAPSWLRNGIPQGSLVYERQDDGSLKSFDVAAHRWDANGYWVLIEENDTIRPIRYSEALDETGSRLLPDYEFKTPDGKDAPAPDTAASAEATAPAPEKPRNVGPASRVDVTGLFPVPVTGRPGLASQRAGINRAIDRIDQKLADMDEDDPNTAPEWLKRHREKLVEMRGKLEVGMLGQMDQRLSSAPLAATVTEAEGAEKTVAAWRLPFRAVGIGEDKLNRGAVDVARAAGRMIDKGASLTGVKSLVSKMAGSAAGDAVGAAWAEVRRQIAPMSVLPREVAAKLLDTKAAMTWSKVRAGELHKLLKIGSEGGLAEMTEGFHVPKEANTGANHRLLSQYFRGKVPIDDVPESLRPLAKSVTDQWTERGRQMVEAGIMSQRTFDERRANYFPHMFYSKEADEQGGVGWLRSRLKMGLDRVKPQLSTAYYIYQIDETGAPKLDRFGVPRLLEHEPGRWRFTSAQHRNAFFERFVRAQTVEAVRKTGRRSFTEHDLERITLADKDTQATVRALMQKVRAGYQMGKPTDEETLAKMGLIENLAYVVPKSLIQMDHDIALANLFTDLATDSRLVSDVKLGETWKQIPTDPRWGALSGKWVDRDLHAQLIEFHAAPSLAAQIYDAALAKWKKFKTVYNPATHVRNVVGNLFFADLAGVSVQNPDNWHYYYEAIQAMRGNHAWLKTEEMVQHGIIGSDFSMAELKAAFDEIVLPKPEEMERTEPTQALFLRNPGRWFLGKLKSGAKGMETAYRAEDQIFKVAAYLKQRGAGVMPKEAAAHVSKWFPTYSNIGNSTLTRFMRRFTSPFLSFMMEAWRIGGVALAEQPVTLAKWLAIPTMITTLSALALGLSDDDLEAIRKDMRGQVFGMPWFSVLLPWTDDLGRPMQFDLTNVIPYADALGKRNDTDGDDSLMQSVIKKYFLSGPALQLAMAWGFGKNPYTDKSFAQPDMTAGEVLREKLAYTGKMLAPPLTPGIGTADPFAWFTGPEKTGRFLRPRSRGAEVARQLGGIDVRSAEPDPYRMAEEFRKKQGLPQPVGSTDTTLKSRTRADAYKAVVNGDVDGLAAALTKLRDATGTDIRTAQDLEQLFYFRRPLAMIGGDPATKRSAKEMQRLFLGGLSPLENTTVTAAEQRWKEARSKAPLILRQARDKMPPRPPRKPVASAKPRGDATKFFDLTAV